jgi:nitroreductase
MPADRLRPLRRTRQVREFTEDPVDRAELDAIADVARWTGSSSNTQPWRFIVVTDVGVLRQIAEIGVPQTRSLHTAAAAIAIVLPVAEDDRHELGMAYDDGRAAERVLIAAGMLDLGAGIAWVLRSFRAPIGDLLGLPPDRYVRTIVALGHPSEAALAPKARRRLKRELVSTKLRSVTKHVTAHHRAELARAYKAFWTAALDYVPRGAGPATTRLRAAPAAHR